LADDVNLVREQQAPAACDGPDCWLLVMKDMEQRRMDGIAKYGVPVRPENGRDALIDLYQELLDAVVYTRQEIEKRSLPLLALEHMVVTAIRTGEVGLDGSASSAFNAVLAWIRQLKAAGHPGTFVQRSPSHG
jgi:hypothetical protein